MVIGITSQQCLRYFMEIIIMLLAAALAAAGRCWPLLAAAAAAPLLLAAAAAAAVPGWSPAAPTAGPGPPPETCFDDSCFNNCSQIDFI